MFYKRRQNELKINKMSFSPKF